MRNLERLRADMVVACARCRQPKAWVALRAMLGLSWADAANLFYMDNEVLCFFLQCDLSGCDRITMQGNQTFTHCSGISGLSSNPFQA